MEPDGSVREIRALQDQYVLHPPGGAVPWPGEPCTPAGARIPPRDAVDALDGPAFFERLDAIVRADPLPTPPPTAWRRLGVGEGADPTPGQRRAMRRGTERGRRWVEAIARLKTGGRWGPPPDVPIGDYGDRVLVRAVVARIGLGANRSAFALYQNAGADGRGRPLDGHHRYQLVFPPGQAPPAEAFWSVTVYGPDAFLVDHPSGRHALGSTSPLVPDRDGAIILTLSNTPPEDQPVSNWLPIPEGPFEVTLRLYAPREEALTGAWRAPELRRLR